MNWDVGRIDVTIEEIKGMDRNQFGQLLRSTIIPEDASPEENKRKLMPIAKALMAMLPEKLYRYRSCSTLNIDAFDKDLIYAVTADKFNDPYDTLMKYDTKNSESFKKQILSCQNINAEVLEPFCKYIEAVYKKPYIELSDIIKKVSTVACFSETIQSVTMWSHYADNHEGFALEYDLRFIPTEGAAKGYYLFPVVYDDRRFEATDFLSWCIAKGYGMNVNNPDQFAHYKLSLHKSTQWEYEKEWRLFHNLQDCSNKSRATSLAIAPKAIYYGQKISPINRKLLHYIAQEKDIAEYDMYIESSSLKYEMLFKPVVF